MRISSYPMKTILAGLFLLTTQLALANEIKAPSAPQITENVEEYMKAAVKFDQFSGSVLVARDGSPVVSKGYGMANYELNVPSTPQTVFNIGSLTKQFTAMAILQLQERGKLNINDSMCKYLDDCPAAWQPVTIRHLLAHTSGIVNFSSLAEWDEKLSLLPYTRSGFVKLFRDLPLQFAPGEKFKYSNSGYYLLGLIVERTSGKSYPEFLSENIFAPLGMKNTGYDDARSLIPNLAAGYDWSLNSFVKSSYLNPATAYSAGGLYSTTGDMLLWDQALYTEKLVSHKSLGEIFTPVQNGFGYGWQIGKKFDRNETHHSGSISGFSAFIFRFPSERVTVIILSNSDRTSAAKAASNLAAIVFGAKYELPKPQVSDVLTATFVQKGIDATLQQYRELERTRPENYNFKDSESTLNRLGYDLLADGKVKEALEIFKLNVERFPKSSNRRDSLADAYLAVGDKESAIKSFEIALELDPQNPYSLENLKQLRETH